MAIRIWSEEAGTFVEPEDILACGADGVYYSVPRIDAPAADGAWGQVWPEKLWIIKDGNLCPGFSFRLDATPNPGVIGARGVKPTVKYADGYISISIPRPSSGFDSGKVYVEPNIDLTPYKKTKFSYKLWRVDTAWTSAELFIGGVRTGIGLAERTNKVIVNFTGTELDISKLSDTKNTYFEIVSRTTSFSNYDTEIQIVNLWLEP